MTSNFHTPIPSDPNEEATAALFNSRFSSLDSGITGNAAAIISGDGVNAAAIIAGDGVNAAAISVVSGEVVAARNGWPKLDDRLDAMDVSGTGTSTGLPLTAGPSYPLSGTLYMDPGSDDSTQLFRVPVTSANNGDILFNIGAATFDSVVDAVWNLGFNNPISGGKVDPALHSFYLQMENDYKEGGKHWVEFHLNLAPVVASQFRPFQFKYNTDGSEGTLNIRASEFSVTDLDALYAPILCSAEVGGSYKVNLYGKISITPEAASDAAFFIQSSTPEIMIMNLSTNNDSVQSRVSSWSWSGLTGGAKFIVDTTNGIYVGANANGTFTSTNWVSAGTPAGSFVAHASQSVPVLDVRLSNNTTKVFAVGANGQIWTNQATANTAVPSGATAYKLPIYDGSGSLLGYIPIYAGAWS